MIWLICFSISYHERYGITLPTTLLKTNSNAVQHANDIVCLVNDINWLPQNGFRRKSAILKHKLGKTIMRQKSQHTSPATVSKRRLFNVDLDCVQPLEMTWLFRRSRASSENVRLQWANLRPGTHYRSQLGRRSL